MYKSPRGLWLGHLRGARSRASSRLVASRTNSACRQLHRPPHALQSGRKAHTTSHIHALHLRLHAHLLPLAARRALLSPCACAFSPPHTLLWPHPSVPSLGQAFRPSCPLASCLQAGGAQRHATRLSRTLRPRPALCRCHALPCGRPFVGVADAASAIRACR